MKFELKTENDNFFKSISHIFVTIFNIVLIIIFFDVALKLGTISRNYKIDYYCKLLVFDKSTSNFKKLSILSNLKGKQKIWEFCKEFVK
jgi:hypothetical protein